jgi:hypothetical protein
VPEPEQLGVFRQRIPAESLHHAAFGELHDPQQIASQMSPTELRLTLVILQIRAETVAAQDALEDRSQQADQNLAAAGGSDKLKDFFCPLCRLSDVHVLDNSKVSQATRYFRLERLLIASRDASS